MGNGMNKVLPGLYVGNYRDSKDQQQLDKHQITHIIAIHDSPRRLLPDKHYLCVMAADTPDQNLSQYFSVCNDFIHAARLREGNVLIHCLAGMSRSVTVAVAYIMTATNLSWKEALKVVRAGRAVANPNIGFQTQLQEFEMYRLMEERRRLRERFPSTALEHLDRSKCSAALDNYQELLQNRDICEGNCTRGEKCPTGAMMVLPLSGEISDLNGGQTAASGSYANTDKNVAYMISFAAEKWEILSVDNSGLKKGGDEDDDEDDDEDEVKPLENLPVEDGPVKERGEILSKESGNDDDSNEICFEDNQTGQQLMENVLYFHPMEENQVPIVSPTIVEKTLPESTNLGAIENAQNKSTIDI
uniref:Dual specificity protein phosphatase 15 n=1 Tax=Bactrocera latifrons TaxID=174628 RepID=A0A0K8VYC3_BACLA